MTKRVQLEQLAKKIQKCKKCRLWKTRIIAVPGEGNPHAKILFLGESPGREEDKIGKPFVGLSGKFLDWLLQKYKIKRKEIFITSVIKCHPPQNRNPRPDEILSCEKWWKTQFKIIQPKIVVLLGQIALKVTVGRNNLTDCHGKKIVKNSLIYFPTFHPAAGHRFPTVKKKMINDFKKLKNIIMSEM